LDSNALKRVAHATLLVAFCGVMGGCSVPPPNAPGSLTIGVIDSPVGLDPVEHPSPTVVGIAGDVFETLVRSRPGTFDVEPGLSWAWTTSPDGMTWNFRLRPGRKFSDGTPLDATAVKENFDRWRSSNDPNRDDLDYPGYPPYFGGFDGASIIDDVRVVDANDLVIHTRTPFAPLLRDLALPQFGIGSPTAFTNDYRLFDQIPIGSGRYVVSEFVVGDHVTLTPNPFWAGKANVVPSIVVRTIPDPMTALPALTKDDVDAVADPTPPVARLIATRPAAMRLVAWPSDALGYLIFDYNRAPFDAPELRRAVAETLDRRAIALRFGSVTPARGWFLPGMLGDDPANGLPSRDIASARTTFAHANLGNVPVTLYYPADGNALLPDPAGLAQAIASDLGKAGLSVAIQPIAATQIPPTGPGGAMAIGVVEAPSGDPDEAIAPLTASWHDAAFAALANQGRSTMDESARASIYRQIDDLIESASAAVPLAYPARSSAVSARATGPFNAPLLPPALYAR
jgi:peptide/nickel transport system substrate-binding protein